MSLESTQHIAPQSALTLTFGLRPSLNLRVRGQTVASYSGPGNKVHRHRVAFEALPENVQAAIVAYVNDAWRAALMSRL